MIMGDSEGGSDRCHHFPGDLNLPKQNKTFMMDQKMSPEEEDLCASENLT